MTEGQKLILVVDDNPVNLQALGKILTDRGYNVGVVDSGEKALDFVKDRIPDLILLDVMMPGLDGFETCMRLKGNRETNHIPVIFLTARVETEDIVRGFDVGGTDYVTKPFITEELLARIKTHMELKTLRKLIPVCAECKMVRDENGRWILWEEFIQTHTESRCSHGLCRTCADKLYGKQDWYGKKRNRRTEGDK